MNSEQVSEAKTMDKVEELKAEILKLKLSTCSTLWWDDDVKKFDSPENYAEENRLKIGEEFELQGARYRQEKFRLTKIADEKNDDWECEEITPENPDDFEPYFSILKRAEVAEARSARLTEALQKLTGLIRTMENVYGNRGAKFLIQADTFHEAEKLLSEALAVEQPAQLGEATR